MKCVGEDLPRGGCHGASGRRNVLIVLLTCCTYALSALAANDGQVCPLLGIVPSPVIHEYRNKCEVVSA